MIINKPETQGLTSFTINVSLLLLCVKALIFIINPDFHWLNLLKIFEYSPCRYMISKQFCRIFFLKYWLSLNFKFKNWGGVDCEYLYFAQKTIGKSAKQVSAIRELRGRRKPVTSKNRDCSQSRGRGVGGFTPGSFSRVDCNCPAPPHQSIHEKNIHVF